jgi:hypothetical protein
MDGLLRVRRAVAQWAVAVVRSTSGRVGIVELGLGEVRVGARLESARVEANSIGASEGLDLDIGRAFDGARSNDAEHRRIGVLPKRVDDAA